MNGAIMECVQYVWNTGKTSPYDLETDNVFAFRKATGSSLILGMRWRNNGVVHEISTYQAVVLPDKSGVATTSKWGGHGTNWMDVINADGTLRFRLFPPELSERLDHTQAALEAPRPGWPASGIAFGVQAGYKDKVGSLSFGTGTHIVSVGVFLAIDWATGNLKDWKVIPPFV